MVEFLLEQFKICRCPSTDPMRRGIWASPLDISQAISPPLAQWMIDAPDPIVENGRSGGPPELN